jgi:hypothetical protein
VAVAVAVGVEPVAVALGVGVVVVDGVALATEPNATPLKLTIWVATVASSLKVSLPVSVVPVAVVSVVGLKVTETWQLELAATDAPQPFAVMSNGPLVAIEVKVTATALEFDSVTVCAGETVLTWILPKLRDFGDTVGVSMTPTPDTPIVCVGVTASSVTTIFPVLAPFCDGVNITPKVQVPPAATDVPLQLSLTVVKSPEGTTLVTLSETLLGLVRVMVFAALATSTGWSPKLRLAGE